jgi:hypothetical protein
MYFSNKQVSPLLTTVDLFHSQYILENVGLSALSRAERVLLQNNGVDLASYKGKRTPVEEAYFFGKSESSARNKKDLNRLDLKQFRQFMAENPELFKPTRDDLQNIKLAKQQTAADIRNLANTIKHDLQQTLVEVSKTTDAKTPKKAIINTITGHLAESTKKASSRFQLISSYRMHATFQDGIAAEILHRLGPNAKVYFSVHPQACDKCVKLYLKHGRGSQSKIFLLGTILKNGSNIGRKPNQLLPSRYPVHPNCRCKMNLLPKGKVNWSTRQNHYVRVFK